MDRDPSPYTPPFLDERLDPNCCAYCGNNEKTTLDHVPPRVFLDSPLPSLNPIGVRACGTCNASFSAAEEYVAVLLDAISHGTRNTNEWRSKTRKAVAGNSWLLAQAREIAERTSRGDDLAPGNPSVMKVMRKLAIGHWTMQLGERPYADPKHVVLQDCEGLSPEHVDSVVYSMLGGGSLFPEVGSKAFVLSLTSRKSSEAVWQVVQPDRYSYNVARCGIAVLIGKRFLGIATW